MGSRKDFPATWINAYDASQTINNEQLYDLRAIPSVYLLDKDKMVRGKDIYNVALLEALLRRSEGIE